MPDLIGKVIPILKRSIQMEYGSLVDSLIKKNLSSFKELHKNPLLKFKKLDFDDIEMESTDINREIIESGGFLPKKYQKLLKNEINRRIESQDFRDGQSFNKTKLILDTNERIDQLIELLKKQKQYMPVWNIRKLVYGFFGEKVKDMSLFDLIEENPFDMIIVYTNIDRNLSYSYRYNTLNRRNDFASLGYYAEKDDKIHPSNYEYPSPYFIMNHHKIDSDLQLYRWFVEAERHKRNTEEVVLIEGEDAAKSTSCFPFCKWGFK